MRKPPQDKKAGVFTTQILVDMTIYGFIMGLTTLLCFIIVVYGANGGELGHDCNRQWSESCEPVFRARAAVFSLLTWEILISAWEFKSIRHSLFSLNPDPESPGNKSRLPPVFGDVYENRFLFWAVVLGACSVFATVYIPVLNTQVFKHTAIGWEWSLVVGFTIVFVLGIELWKFTKRSLGILDDHKVVQGRWSQGSEQGRKFTRSLSMGSLKSWKSWAKGESRGRTQSNTLTNSTTLTARHTAQGSPDMSRQATMV